MNVTEKERTEEEYENQLTDIYGDVNICGMKYPAGRALRLLDPIAFRCSLADNEIIYQCGECDEEHESEEEAKDCCKRKYHLCDTPTENKWCSNETCAEYIRDEKTK